jgi:hypothetical protein
MKGQSTTATSPAEYLAELAEPRRGEITRLDAIIRETVPALTPFLHAGMLAYGPIHYRYATGREGDWFLVGIANNAAAISLYACAVDARGYVAERYKNRFPKAKIGKSCVRFKRVADLDLDALRDLLSETAATGFGM